MHKVAIIIPTMNRPDLILRQFEFYELMNSPHPIYVSDSSNEENAKKLIKGIEKFKTLKITYQWASPGKDHLYSLLELVKEKFCIQMGDDDIMIPDTISECADFLEQNHDYGTCMGKQVNIRFRKEDYNNAFGKIGQQTRPMGRSVEGDDMLVRIKDFWSNPYFICFVVRRTETERKLRKITKNFSLMERMLEFLLVSNLIICGKSKILDKLGYVMQISDNRYNFEQDLYLDFVLSPDIKDKWKIARDGLSEIIFGTGKTKEDSDKIAKWMFIVYLAHQFKLDVDWLPVNSDRGGIVKNKNYLKRAKYIILNNPVLSSIYHKFKPPHGDVAYPGSKYYNDFKNIKDFLEKNRTP
jgi:glycosyltransferase domain-containing protein